MRKKEIIQKLSFGYKLIEMSAPYGDVYFISDSNQYTNECIIRKSQFDELVGLCNKNRNEHHLAWLKGQTSYNYYWIEND